MLDVITWKSLEVGGNARYRSHTIIGEFLEVLATVVEEEQAKPVFFLC